MTYLRPVMKAGWMSLMLMVAMPLAVACQVSVVAVSFGSFDNLNNPVDANGLVSVQCTVPTPVSIQLDAGIHASGVFQQRKLSTVSGQTLNYNLYLDTAHVLVWGDGTGGTQVVSGMTGGIAAIPLDQPVYGRIASGQRGSVGVYSDAITVTVIW